jgi:predicted ester cyclase
MTRLAFGCRSLVLVALALSAFRAFPVAAAATDVASRATALWNQPAWAVSFSGYEGEDGFDLWQAAYPADGLFAFDHVLHVAGRSDVVHSSGPRFLIAEYWQAFPDLALTVDGTRVDGDRLTVDWTIRGDSLGAFDGLAPTGKAYQESGSFVYRIVDGQIVETWVEAHTDDLLRRTGAQALPPVQPWTPSAPLSAPASVPAENPAAAPDDAPYTAA